jgi:ribosomal protein S6E (S10)
VGFNAKKGGERKRKAVRGNVITDDIVQINTKIVEKPKSKDAKAEEAKAEAKAAAPA